jgi:hypothetical protein
VLINTIHGVITLALDDGHYAWAFVGVDHTVRDSGSGVCH